ncbi:Hypothetical protein FORC77_2011 [Vibrio vulnificus]|nr:Hypothetical protein FORC77_2011 [Vibrio vulnificus]
MYGELVTKTTSYQSHSLPEPLVTRAIKWWRTILLSKAHIECAFLSPFPCVGNVAEKSSAYLSKLMLAMETLFSCRQATG